MKRLFFFLIFCFLFTCQNSLISQAKSDKAIEKHVLSNGLTLILKEEPSRDLISLCAFLDGGARIESTEVAGISHFIEHLVFRGPSLKSDELELRKKFRIWGEFEGFTSHDVTCYGFTSRPDDFDEALDAYVDGLMNLTIPESVIEKERTVVSQEIHQRGDMPHIKLYELFASTAYKAHPYKKPVIGYEDLIKNIASDVIRNYYKDHYTPDHLVIAVVGNFESDDMVSRIDKIFADYKPSGKNFEIGIIEPPQDGERLVIEESDVSSMHLLLGFRIPPARKMTSPILEVLAEVLTGSEDSRLYKRLKVDNQLADEVYCYPSLKHDESFFHFLVMAKPENRDEIQKSIHEEIERVVTKPPTDDEIKRAKRRIENDFYFNHQTFYDQALNLVTWEIYGNLELGYKWVDAVNKVVTDDVIEVAKKYFTKDSLTWVALVPRPKEEIAVSGDASYVKESPRLALNDKGYGSLTLHNGLKMIFKKDTASNIVGISVLAGFGQLMEERGKEGIGNFCSRMLEKGAGNMDAEAFRKRAEEIGARITTEFDRDYIKINLEIAKDRIDEGLALLNKVIFEPRFDNEEIELVRTEILAGIERKKDSSFPLVNDEFRALVYGDTPYGKPLEGYSETVELINREALKKYHTVAFATKNMIIGITGDLEPEPLSHAINQYFGIVKSYVKAEDIEYAYPIEHIPTMKHDEKILNLTRTQVSFNLGLVGPEATSPDYPALRMLVRLLGLRVFDKYVYELGWAYRMWFYMSTSKGPSPIMFEMGVAETQFDEARDGLIEAMRNVTEKPITRDEFQKTLDYVLQSFHLAMQKNVDTAYYLAYFEKLGLGWEYVMNYDDIYKALTISDLSRAARMYFHPDEMKLVAIMPSSE